ncbi:MAG: hypothetical protein ABIJ56_12450, partial [Pseudomonadota bacterium]
MICPYCHFPNETFETFCLNCGAPLPSKKKPAPAGGSGFLQPAAPPPGAPPAFTRQPTAVQPPGQVAPGAYSSAASPAAPAAVPPQYPAQAQTGVGTGMPVKKKKMSGCAIAAVIIAVLVAVPAVIIIVLVFGMGLWLTQPGDEQLSNVNVAAVAEPDEAGEPAEKKPKEALPAEKEEGKTAETQKAAARESNPLLKN